MPDLKFRGEIHCIPPVRTSSRKLFYKEFELLNTFNGVQPGEHMLQEIEELLAKEEWNSARISSSTLIDKSLNGLRYLQMYVDWQPIYYEN